MVAPGEGTAYAMPHKRHVLSTAEVGHELGILRVALVHDRATRAHQLVLVLTKAGGANVIDEGAVVDDVLEPEAQGAHAEVVLFTVAPRESGLV